jgi:hypothetical protein
MTLRAFLVLFVVTVFAIAVGDHFAQGFAPPGFQRTFSVLVIAALIVGPVAWLLGRIGWIQGRLELGRKHDTQGDGGGA